MTDDLTHYMEATARRRSELAELRAAHDRIRERVKALQGIVGIIATDLTEASPATAALQTVLNILDEELPPTTGDATSAARERASAEIDRRRAIWKLTASDEGQQE